MYGNASVMPVNIYYGFILIESRFSLPLYLRDSVTQTGPAFAFVNLLSLFLRVRGFVLITFYIMYDFFSVCFCKFLVILRSNKKRL
ncbi:hypothetical protein EEL51_03555 [Muribaculaceae bacterium Isolate-110 (HZI)]|nr:hypothetical protein EEL51_03555 [Muribaculaceae bacterium Isolate-110 (HZI)]